MTHWTLWDYAFAGMTTYVVALILVLGIVFVVCAFRNRPRGERE